MILETEFMILHLNRFLVNSLLNLHLFVVILIHIVIIGIRAFRLLTTPEHTSRTLGQRQGKTSSGVVQISGLRSAQ